MPSVSVIIPCFNEQSTIYMLLEAVYNQTYPRSEIEVIIADGRSTDGTRQMIASFSSQYPDLQLQVVDNPRRVIPSALNCAIQAARGEYVIRLDGHCMPDRDYIERSISGLKSGLGDNVGGVWQIRPGGNGWMSRAIAAAAAHPIAVGDALYRYATQPGAVDTVPFGAFRRELVERIGGFDETLLINEDYEFNTRIRQSGGKVWLDPAIRSVYFARANLAALARQYFRYGFWKYRMLLRYPATLRWRQALPPIFVLSLVILSLFSTFLPLPVALVPRWALFTEICAYLVVLFSVAVLQTIKRKDLAILFGFPAAVAVMHLSWGTGFLASMINRVVARLFSR